MNIPDEFRQGDEVELQDILDARERRAERQRELLAGRTATLISFTLNIPGPRKNYPLAQKTFDAGCAVVSDRLKRLGMPAPHWETRKEKTGFELFAIVDAPAARVKAAVMEVEERHPLGRLFDIDVFSADGAPLRGSENGRGIRTCLVCGAPVWECARSRAHPAEELAERTAEIMYRHFSEHYADHMATLAARALLYEVACTPKPGLVDRNNSGAHADMDLYTFIDSATAVTPYFREITLLGIAYEEGLDAMLPALRLSGQLAENAMLAATGGVNTHKGAIFSLGLMCAATGQAWTGRVRPDADSLLDACAAIAKNTPDELKTEPATRPTHGEKAYRKYGITGARGEAAAGYPCVRRHGLPVLERCRAEGASWNDAGVAAFLHLLAHADDSNMVTRADASTLRTTQTAITEKLAKERNTARLVAYADDLDRQFIAKNLSPGGCADLLAMAYFLAFYRESASPENTLHQR